MEKNRISHVVGNLGRVGVEEGQRKGREVSHRLLRLQKAWSTVVLDVEGTRLTTRIIALSARGLTVLEGVALALSIVRRSEWSSGREKRSRMVNRGRTSEDNEDDRKLDEVAEEEQLGEMHKDGNFSKI